MIDIKWLRVFMYIVMACVFLSFSCHSVGVSAQKGAIQSSDQPDYFSSLQKRLINDGFDKEWIQSLYAIRHVKFNISSVSSYFAHNEATLNYDQFKTQERIDACRQYIKRYAKELNAAEQTYGVDKEIITAIISVESNFGANIGKQSVFNTLSTMAALNDRNVRNFLWEKVKSTTTLTEGEFEAKADKKSNWAYEELKAFLSYVKHEKIPPLAVSGSYAGAMGIAQFMPTNIIKLGIDGNGDGQLDMFDHADAIMSIANYLKKYGWYPSINRESAYRVVFEYNHSSYYVNTILDISEILKTQQGSS